MGAGWRSQKKEINGDRERGEKVSEDRIVPKGVKYENEKK